MSSVVGVDFGVLNSLIAAAGRGGVDVILNGNSNRLNPSMVTFDESRRMGEGAGTAAVSKFKTTIRNMKRLIGLSFDDPRAKMEMKYVPFECFPLEHTTGGPTSIGVKATVDGEDKIIPIEQVAGMLIHHLGEIAANKAAESSGVTDKDAIKGLMPQDWVIGIPPYYTDAQRRALLTGCEIVGVTGIQKLMHENAATALAYGIFKDIRKEFTEENPTNIMFIDFGSSAYTVTIASSQPQKLTIKSCAYDENLGGRDFDQTIADWVAKKFVEKYGNKLSGTPQSKPKVMLKILAAAEKAKKTLSPQGVNEASINLECLMDDFDFHVTLKKAEYEAMCKPLIDRLAGPIETALAEAKMTSADLSSVEITGGSTRIQFVKNKMMEVLKVDSLSTTMNADEAVARGTALQSAILSPRFKVLPYTIVDYQPLPIKLAWDQEKGSSAEQGVEVEGDAEGADAPANSVVMFNRGLDFPIVRRVTLRRSGDFNVSCLYDSSATQYGLPVDSTHQITDWTITAPPGEEKKIRVNVKEDVHGIINMSSVQMIEEIEDEEGEKDENGEKKKKSKRTNLDFTAKKPLDWSKAEVDKFQEYEVQMGNNDRIVRETANMRNSLESYIYDMRDKIISENQLGPYATESEKADFTKVNEATENWLYEDGFDANKSAFAAKLEDLKKLGGPIEKRAAEAVARPPAISALQKNIEDKKKWLADAQSNDAYAHITADEFSKAHAKCDEVSSWLYDMMDKQGSLASSVDPAFTAADVNAKAQEMQNVVGPIMYKPKPKPVDIPKEAPKETPKKEEEPTPMDTDTDEAKEEKAAEDTKMEVDEA
mmetsp:Transcript_34271/g.82538  ORF Transcript_34271/g.82538 Transcript_34271/m.82538 type:complete len:823 (-) Transcript_34271:1408-3876(-)